MSCPIGIQRCKQAEFGVVLALSQLEAQAVSNELLGALQR